MAALAEDGDRRSPNLIQHRLRPILEWARGGLSKREGAMLNRFSVGLIGTMVLAVCGAAVLGPASFGQPAQAAVLIPSPATGQASPASVSSQRTAAQLVALFDRWRTEEQAGRMTRDQIRQAIQALPADEQQQMRDAVARRDAERTATATAAARRSEEDAATASAAARRAEEELRRAEEDAATASAAARRAEEELRRAWERAERALGGPRH